MGRFIDVGQEATGIIAIGQMATGFFALGQIATGVSAIGQVARGFFVIGQVSFGVLAVGMGSGGLIGSVGMLGFGGRGLGGILPIVPRLTAPVQLPQTVDFRQLASTPDGSGWVRATLETDGSSYARLVSGGAALPVRVDARLRRVLPSHWGKDVLVAVRRTPEGYVCESLMQVPEDRLKVPRWWAIWAVQLALLAVACVAFWYVVVRPIMDGLSTALS
jgi:hypothetical protein